MKLHYISFSILFAAVIFVSCNKISGDENGIVKMIIGKAVIINKFELIINHIP